MPSIIKNSSVRATRPGAASERSPSDRSCEKSVELLRQGGVVHAIQITCSCGDTTVVELDYPEPSPPAESTEVSA